MPFSIPANHAVRVSAVNVTNPGVADFITVFTSSDTTPVDAFVRFPHQVSPTLNSFTATSIVGGNTGVDWTFQFTTSANGALVSDHGQVLIEVPAGTVLPSDAASYEVQNLTSGDLASPTAVSLPSSVNPALAITVPLAVAAGDRVWIHIRGVTNPPPGTSTTGVDLATTSDVFPAHVGSGQWT
jgi:hypothetical protein